MFNLLPKNPKFYDELESLSQGLSTAAKELDGLAGAPANHDAAEKVAEEERKADRLSRDSLQSLDNAFITPFDREDILALIDCMYSGIETMSGVAQRIELYDLKDADPLLKKRTATLAHAAASLDAAVHRLRHKHGIKDMQGDIESLYKLECESDGQRREFLGSLFAKDADPLTIMKRKDVHDLVERAMNDCEAVSRTLQRVLLKNS